tara:strand:- start:117 stop:464 length:348 start_codon:yes stop_codon:yes gene_type:complete
MMENEWGAKTLKIDDSKSIEQVAKELGVDPAKIRDTVQFSMLVHEMIQDRDLSFQQSLSALLSVVSDMLRESVPELPRAEIVTDIYQTLWGSCGLPTDTLPKVYNYGTKGQSKAH